MKRVANIVYRALQLLLTLLMGLLILPIVLQIVSRFSPSIPHFIWTEEIARFCFIWVIMIGSMIGVRDGAHFHLDLLAEPRNPRARAIGRLWVHGAMLLVALTFFWFGYRFALFGWAQASELTGLNMLTIHIAWPLAGLVFTLFLAEKIADDVALMRPHPPAPAGSDSDRSGPRRNGGD
ncbi:MAG TPA: TRAP transporter small permease [Burkholderiales bacterium]|nr:TRAP transporter small permease [Burkholderiales bacterium]